MGGILPFLTGGLGWYSRAVLVLLSFTFILLPVLVNIPLEWIAAVLPQSTRGRLLYIASWKSMQTFAHLPWFRTHLFLLVVHGLINWFWKRKGGKRAASIEELKEAEQSLASRG